MSLAHDVSTIFRRSMRATLRNPVIVIVGIMQPFLYLFLFAPLLTRFTATPGFGRGTALQVFVPGLLVQQALISCSFVGFAIIGEARAGVLDRMRAAPISELGVLLGRILRDVVVLVVQAVLLLAGAYAMGMRASLTGLLAVFVVLVLVAAGTASLSYGLALRAGAEDVFGRLINMLMLPVMLLSGVLLPMTLAPGWLAGVARVNPLSHVVAAVRALFLGSSVVSGTVAVGFALAVAVAAVSVGYGVRTLLDTRR